MIIEVKQCITSGCTNHGGKHRFEWDTPTGREFMEIQEILGITPDVWEERLTQMAETIDSSVIKVALMMLMLCHRREGIKVAFDEVDFRFEDLQFIWDPIAESEEKPTEPIPTSLQPEEPLAAATTSGTSAEAESEPRSSITEPDSGGSTDSP